MTERAASGTRETILKACRAEVEANGAGVRMSDIAKAAGVSRQAVYLHFPTRADLLIATIRYAGDQEKVDERLVASRTARTGEERLAAYIEAWGGFLPRIYPLMAALLAMRDTDDAARAAWSDRMGAIREGCQAAVEALQRDGRLSAARTIDQSVDLLWTLMSLSHYQNLVLECGWTREAYTAELKALADQALVADR